MIPTDVIRRKRDGLTVPTDDLEAFFEAYLGEDVPDYQMSAFLMAVYFRGLDDAETDVLVRVMLGSGATLDLGHLPGPRVDKHSTGGVGDKVSLALAPLAAAVGLYVPMMSGRGLGHTGGTLDKLEAIPGFRTDLELERFTRIVEEVGCGMIGQTGEIAPLDRRLYALRDVTATVPAIPLIAASIMSKKLAEDLDGLLLDVKVGDGAFIAEEERALTLARRMVAIGAERSLPVRALLTAMDRPLGVMVGNALETAEAIECLRGAGPADLRALVIAEVAEMVVLGEGRRGADRGDAGTPAEPDAAVVARVTEALDSGAAFERFVRLVEIQGGDARVVDDTSLLPQAPERAVVRAGRAGVVARVAPRALGEGVGRLGGGRQRVDQAIDPSVGFELRVRPGDQVAAGDPLGVVHAGSPGDAEAGVAVLTSAVEITDVGTPVPLRPLVSHRLG